VVAVLTFIVRRSLWAVLCMFVITVIVFFIFFKTPGVDPARAIAGRNPSPQVLAEVRAQLGLNRPLWVQYGLMMKKIFISRDLVSYSDQGIRVVPEIFGATSATLSVVFGATVIWIVMAIATGVAAAVGVTASDTLANGPSVSTTVGVGVGGTGCGSRQTGGIGRLGAGGTNGRSGASACSSK